MDGIKRVILIDWSVVLHVSCFSLKFNPAIPATYTAISIILGYLSRVGVDPDDVIMFLLDGRHSWRKEVEKAYKSDRKEKRADVQINDQNLDITNIPGLVKDEFNVIRIDWDYWFERFNNLKEQLDQKTNWIFVGPIEHIEADDLAAVACRYYKDVPEIVLVTIDSDWEQMWAIHPGVKIFSTKSKEWKLKPENYNVNKEIAKKINKEKSDNLITAVTNLDELDNRQMCVDLTRLPEWVEKICVDAFANPLLYEKNIYPEELPFNRRSKEGEHITLQDRFDKIYNDKSKVIIYEVQKAKLEKKEARKKEKKKSEKEKIKKQKEKEKKKMEVLNAV